jgi:O-antigen ligase
MSPNRVVALKRATLGILGVMSIILLTPLRSQIFGVLPFFGGTIDIGDVTYRHLLFQRGWELFKDHPIFGDQLAYLKMEPLRQGEGIIDFVNTYVQVALDYGLVGLTFFVGFMMLGLKRTWYLSRKLAPSDPDAARIGAALISCALGTLLMIQNVSFIFGYEKMYYVLAGFLAAYCRVAWQTASEGTSRPHAVLSVR